MNILKKILLGIVGFFALMIVIGVMTDSGEEQAELVTQQEEKPRESEEEIIPVLTEYTLTAETSFLVGQRTFKVTGETNLPDGAVLSVTIFDEEYHSYDDVDTDWRLENLTYVTDSITTRHGKFSKNIDVGDTFIAPLKSDVYTVELAFKPWLTDQPNKVVQMVGEDGEYLDGALVKKDASGSASLELLDSVNIKDTSASSDITWSSAQARQICASHPDWTQSDCERLAENRIWIGMHYDMLIYLRGKPNAANPSNYGYGTEWQWCWYDYTPSCFYGENDGIVDSYN